MEKAIQELQQIISTINAKFPEDPDLKNFPGINRSLITDSLTQSANQMILLKEYNDHFETIVLKRELSDIYEKINDEIKGSFGQIKPSVFNNFLKQVSKIRFIVKETYLSVVSSEHFRAESEIVKVKADLLQLTSDVDSLKKVKTEVVSLKESSQTTISKAVEEITTSGISAAQSIQKSVTDISGIEESVKDTLNKKLEEVTRRATQIASLVLKADTDRKESNKVLVESQELLDKIKKYNSEIESVNANVAQWNQDIQKAKDAIDANEKAYVDLNKRYGVLIQNIEKANEKITGKKDANGKVMGGYLSEFEILKASIEKFLQEQSIKYDTQFKEIEGLLPGATSAGLAQAYQDQKKSYSKPIFRWSIVFIGTLIAMIGFSLYVIIEQIRSKSISDLASAFTAMLRYLPFYVPTIWLVAYASKQQSQSKRLQQEYAFKEANAKSFHGHKVQIEELMKGGTADKQLLEKLVESLVNITAQNPSQTLDSKSHNDSPPAFKILERIVGVTKSEKGKKKEAVE